MMNKFSYKMLHFFCAGVLEIMQNAADVLKKKNFDRNPLKECVQLSENLNL